MASTVTIKLYVKDENAEVIKRFVVNTEFDGDESTSLDYFINRVKESGTDVTKYDWQYKDEENDTVTFSSQQEFDVALSQAVPENNDKILRLYFVKKDLAKKKESEITRKQENIRKKIRAVIALRLIVLGISLLFLALTLLYTFDTHDSRYEAGHAQAEVDHILKPQRDAPRHHFQEWVQQQAHDDTPRNHFQEWVKQVREAEEREQLLIQERQAKLREQFIRENQERQERLRQEHEKRQIALKQQEERRRLVMERERQEQERIRREFHERQEQERKRLIAERERQIREREKQERERIEKAKKEREMREKEDEKKFDQEKYEYLNQVLVQLGYTNREMNMALLRTHEGDLTLVMNALQLFH